MTSCLDCPLLYPLVFSIDDLRPDLSVYPDQTSFLSPDIHSPNLARLASRATTFDVSNYKPHCS